jgi:hypothetical protein
LAIFAQEVRILHDVQAHFPLEMHWPQTHLAWIELLPPWGEVRLPREPIDERLPLLVADSSDVDQGYRVKAIIVPAIPIKVGAQRRWRD